jgi:Helix-turn-helix of DDE superfamily endonuclease
VLFYRAALPLSSKTLKYVAGTIRRHRASIGSLWRKLNPGQQALLVLVYLRKGETYPEVAAGFGVGTATAWRYVNETVELLAARAPKLRKAVRNAKKAGYRTGEKPNRNRRRKPTAPTRSSAHPVKGQTP